MIDSMFQDGTDQAVRDMLRRPGPVQRQAPKFRFGDLGAAAPQGVGAAAGEGIAFSAEILGAFGSVAGAYPEAFGATGLSDEQRQQAEQARRKLLDSGPTYSNEAGDIFRQRAAEIMPDPQATHSSAVILAGVSKFAGKAVGYALTTGPAAPVLLGGDEAFTEADKLKQAGVDLPTRAAAGAVAGTVAGLSVALPVVGTTVARTTGLVAAGGPGGYVAQNLAEHAILEHGGRKDLAEQYDPFDPVGLALSTLVPAAFGVHGYRARAGTGKLMPPVKSEADMRAAAALTPEEQARSAAFEASPANLAELESAIAAEKNPENKAALQAELETQRTAAARGTIGEAMTLELDAEAAARVSQVNRMIDDARLTPDDDLAGTAAHTDAMTLAHEQIAAGERVDVAHLLDGHEIAFERLAQVGEQLRDGEAPRVAPDAAQWFTGSPRQGLEMTRSLDQQVGRSNAEAQFAGPGHYASTSRDFAGTYGGPEGRLYAVEKPFENPFDFNAVDPTTRKSGRTQYLELAEQLGGKAAANRELRARGYDAITFTSPRGDHLANVFEARALRDVGPAREAPKPLGELSLAPRETAGDNAGKGGAREAGSDSTFAGRSADAARPADAGRPGEVQAGDRPGADPEPQPQRSEEVAAQALERAVADVVKLNPDLLVQLDGMDGPVRVGELLERIKKEAAEDAQDSELVEAAANCFLRN